MSFSKLFRPIPSMFLRYVYPLDVFTRSSYIIESSKQDKAERRHSSKSKRKREKTKTIKHLIEERKIIPTKLNFSCIARRRPHWLGAEDHKGRRSLEWRRIARGTFCKGESILIQCKYRWGFLRVLIQHLRF
jgi:hypothetical protein